jgi:SAM-dependent methyltransferase
MTEAPNRIRTKRPKRAPLRQLRRIFNFLNTFDLDEIARFIGRVEENQSKAAAERQRIQGAMKAFSTEMGLWRQEVYRDLQTRQSCFFNVKNLGYELGRVLAERDLRRTVAEPAPVKLGSKLCVQDDFATDWLSYWCQELRTAPYYHRKIWELCYICQVLFTEEKLTPDRRGLGFGCGQEPLPSVFAKYGVQVMATDLDQHRPEAEVWRLTDQHAVSAESFRRRDICPDEQCLARIEFRPLDMSSIPSEFDGQFDFCWSACALEHLGSLAKGLAFIENSLRTLKPGGVAVHTTEFTLNEGETIDNYPTVLYQARHLIEFAEEMRNKGYEVAEYDFSPGSGILDRFVDLPPWAHEHYIPPQHYAHLKLNIDGYTCTSMGMIIKKPACSG